MTPLEEMSVARPRPEALCRGYARRMDPWWGFVIAGVIWTICTFTVTTLVMLGASSSLGYEAGSRGAQVIAVLSIGIAAATAFVTFRWWRRARLATKELLVREGALVDVTVTGRPFQLGGWKTRTAVDLEGNQLQLRCVFNRWFLPSTGDTIQVLHHRAVPHVVAFDRNGAMYSGHVTDAA